MLGLLFCRERQVNQNNAENIETVQRCAIASTFLMIGFVADSQLGSNKILKKCGLGFGVVKVQHPQTSSRNGMHELI